MVDMRGGQEPRGQEPRVQITLRKTILGERQSGHNRRRSGSRIRFSRLRASFRMRHRARESFVLALDSGFSNFDFPMAKQPTSAISPTRAENFPEWYQQVVKAADLAENSDVR